MATLAINTAGNFVSVAILEGMQVLAQLDSRKDFQSSENSRSVSAGANDRLPPGYTKKRSKRGQATRRVFPPGASVMLAPLIQQLFDQQGISANNLDLICVAIGPGMFTGLRVGVVTAKALAYSTESKLVAVNTLDAIAAQNFATEPAFEGKSLHVAVNAQRRQLFVNRFRSNGPWEVSKLADDQIVDRKRFVAAMAVGDGVTGPGLVPIADELSYNETNLVIAAESSWELTAASVGLLGTRMFDNGLESNYWSIQPLYFRPSAADENLAEQAKK